MVMARALSASCALIALALASCSSDPEAATQLILVADTDVDRIETIEFRVEAAGAPEKTATATRSASGAPAYLTLLREQGPLGPLTVTARGMRGQMQLVSRTHVVSFVEGETLVVPLHLAQSCVGRMCEGQTCGELGCSPRQLDSESLLPWSGKPPEIGGAMGQCGTNEMVDLMTDPAHCGACNAACSASSMSHTIASCMAGSCNTRCEPAFGDCNGRASDGCERSLLEDSKHCGACSQACENNETCSAGVCVRK